MSLDALTAAARAYARVAAQRPTTDICSGSMGEERRRQEQRIELDKLTALEALGKAAIAFAGPLTESRSRSVFMCTDHRHDDRCWGEMDASGARMLICPR